MANSKIPNITLADTLNTQRLRINQLLDSVGDVSALTTAAGPVTNAINELDAELGTITSGAMGTTASTVSGAINELDGRLDSINNTELLSPRMDLTDAAATNTVAGKLEVGDSADFAGNVSVDGNLTVGGNTTMVGTLTVDGQVTFKAGSDNNISLGDAATDTITLTGEVNSNVIPDENNTYDLGSALKEWRHVYVDGTVNADNVAADSATIGTLKVTDLTDNRVVIVGAGDEIEDDANFTFDGNTLSVGNTSINKDAVGINTTGLEADSATITNNADIGGNLDVGGNFTADGNVDLGNASTDTVSITGQVDTDIVPSSNNARSLGSNSKQWRHGYFDGTVNADELAADSATLGTLKVTDLTSGRIVIGGTDGEIADDPDLTYNTTTDTLAVSNIDIGTSAALASAKVEDLTADRIVIAGTGGELEDDANLTFDGTTFSATAAVDITGDLDVDNININGNTITSTNTNGAINITPDGTGEVVISTVTVSDLTDNRIIVAGTSGALEDDANLTFDGTTFTVGATTIVQASGDTNIGGDLDVTGNLQVDGTLTVDGVVNMKAGSNGSVTIGDANTDNVVFSADVNSHITPNINNTYDLGNSEKEWRHGYFDGTVNADALAADSATLGTVKVSDLTNNRVVIAGTSGELEDDTNLTFDGTTFEVGTNFDVDVATGNTNIDGNLDVDGITNLDSTNVDGDLDVTGSFTTITTDGLTEGDNNLYYTTARADSDAKNAVSATDAGGDGSFTYNNATGVFTYTGPSATDVRAHITAGEGIDIVDGEIRGENATTSNKGIASFDTNDFNVSSGAVSLSDTVSASVFTAVDYFEDGSGRIRWNEVSSFWEATDSTGNYYQITVAGPSTGGIRFLDDDDDTLFVSAATGGGSLKIDGGTSVQTDLSGSVLTVSVDDATVSTKGIASFDTNNFSVSSGAVSIKDATTANKGIASFNTDDFSVSSGAVSIKDATVSNKGIASFSSDNFAVSSGEVSIKDNGITLGTETTGNYVATIAGTANEIEVTGSGSETASVTVGLPNDVTVGNNLTVTNDFTVGGSFTVAGEQRTAAQYIFLLDGTNGTPSLNSGITVDRGSEDSAVFQWNETSNYWEAGLTTSVNRLALQNDSAYFTTLNVGDITNDRILIAGANGSVEDDTNLTFNGTTFEVGTAFDVTASSGNTAIGGTLDVTGIARLNKTTDATSSTSGGSLTVDGGAAIAKKLYVGGDLTVTGNTTFNNDVLFDGATSGYNIEWDKSDHSLTFLTGTSLKMGNGDDMSLSVNGSSDTILGTGTNNFYLRSADMRLQSNSNEDYVRGQANGAVTLYHNALNKLATTKYGVDVVGLMEADSAVISGDISIGGNLTVSGTTTTINTETLTLQDNIIVLNSNSAATPTEDAGLEVERGNSTNVMLKWDEGDNRWQFTNDGSTYYNIPISTEYNNTTYSLPLATNTVRGGIELFNNTDQSVAANPVTTTTGRTYGLQLNSAGQGVMNVPWTDTVYSLPLATDTVRGGIELFSNTDQSVAANSVTATAGRTYGIQLNAENQAVVNVPWVDTNTDTNTTYSAGKDLDLNGTTFDIESTLNHVNAITTASGVDFTLTTGGSGDIYLDPNGDTVYMRGGGAAGQQLSFGLQTLLQTINASDTLYITAQADMYLHPYGDTIYMQGSGVAGQQLSFQLDAGEQTITSSANSDLKLSTSGTGDVWLQPNADGLSNLDGSVFMRGSGDSTQQLEFQLNNNLQAIRAVQPLILVSETSDIYMDPHGGDVFMRAQGDLNKQLAFTMGTTYQQMLASDDLIIGATDEMTLYTTGGDIDLNPSTGRIGLFDNGSERAGFDVNTAGTLKIYTGANFGTLNSTFAGDDLTVQGDVTALSDIRTKENVETIENSLDLVSQLRGVWYNKIGEEDRKVGVIAQEVEEVLPEVVKTDTEGMKSVDYGKMVGVLIEAIKDLKAEIHQLKAGN